ncbi:MAG: amidohydrolase family protein, partial [Ferruginibacter sp.]
ISGPVFSQVLIKNTNVLDVENKKLLSGYDVLIMGDSIVSVDKGRTYKLPAGTQIIDGIGKYLIPGLTDAHVHFSQSGSLFTRPDAIDLRKYRPFKDEIKWTHDNMEDILRRYLSAGITSVIDVGSTYNFLSQRDSFTNKPYSPIINMTGPLLTTWVPDEFKDLGKDSPFAEMLTEEGVRQSVREQVLAHADFIKIWYIVLDSNIERGARKNLPLVKAAIDEAHKNHLRIAVHATESITAELAAESGADYLVHSVDDKIITDEFVRLLKKNNTVLCPTLVVGHGYENTFAHIYSFTTDELNLSNPISAASILNYPEPDTALAGKYISYYYRTNGKAKELHTDSIMKINLQKLLVAGVTIATGTDAGNIGTQHAGSYFVELKAMQDAGMNTWQLLQSSTINAAKSIGKQNEWGSIAKNKKANMVLLNANPLDSIANWRKIDWIINKGIAMKPDTIIKNSPEMLVQQQVNAYNAHNPDAFVATYSDTAIFYNFPDMSVLMKGRDQITQEYASIKNEPSLHCKILNRIVQGNKIIDQEEISIDSGKKIHAVVIYIVEAGKITKVYFPD